MSVNVSLGDTPGVSAYFDGQPIQDELEAEIRREEERQEKELRNLLATELEDFEEDFLSDSNSEDDSVNVSRVSRTSSHNHKARQDEQSTVLQASGKLAQLAPDPTGTNQPGDKDSTKDVYYSPVSQGHRPGLKQSEGFLLKHQQNLLLQQQQQHQQQLKHHPHQQMDHHVYHQGQFVPSPQCDGISQGHEGNNNNVFPSYDQDSDDWMMKVQQSHAATASSSSPYQQQSSNHHPHHHHHHPLQQQQQQQFFSPHSLPKIPSGMDNPPLPIPNHLRNTQQQQQAFPSPIVKSPSSQSQPSTPKAITIETSSPILPAASVMTFTDSPKQISDNTDGFENYQVKYKTKPNRNDINENDFYIQNENVEFFRAEGGEEKRSYQQLEILYRARGRELEDLTWKLKQAEEDAAKETRMYKHKLALTTGDVEGGQESLRQCQSLLQQTKSDLSESQALVRSLETQVASLKEAKEELIKKLQVAESTIENLSHQCEELQQSESLSRARNDHENVVASLTQRFERELLSVKEKLDETKSNLEAKHDETVWLKKQLADSTKELEQAQISRGETINRLAKSLEDSQRQCQTLLEQSSSQELASLKVKLQQTIASKSVSEETCTELQNEIRELKEQLSMFESASALGAVSSTSVGASLTKATGKGQGLDDSMTDLGIKKTLDFDTPSSTPKLADTSSLEELVTSLRSELEKCLFSNRQKRAEIAEKGGEIQSLKQELQLSQSKSHDLEKTCADQQMRLKDLDQLMSTKNGESIVEVRLRRDIDALSKEKAILLEDIEDYKNRIEEVGASEAKLTEINTELSAQIAQMVSDFDSDKAAALDRCQRTLEEVHHMTLNNMRAELEGRLESEKGMMAECHKMELDKVKEQLNSAQEEAHSVKSLYILACDEMKKQEEETRSSIRKEVEEELASVSRCKDEAKESAKLQEEKERRLCIEENFAKEKERWNEKQELYEKETQASKHIIAELKSNYEKDGTDYQETISNLKSRHQEEMNALDDRLANLVSSHQAEIQRMKEESDKMEEKKTHFEDKLELVEKLYKAEKEELQKLLQEERNSKSAENSIVAKSGKDVSVLTMGVETTEVSLQVGEMEAVDDVSARERLSQIQKELDLTKENHLMALEKLRSEHKKEFEKAARNREEKFQVELRYFLKNKDDKFKEKLELALQKSQEAVKLDHEKCIKEKEIEIEQLKKKLDDLCLSSGDGNARAILHQDSTSVTSVVEKMNAEKLLMVKKIEKVELEKKEELSSLIDKRDKDERDLTLKYNNKIEVLTQKHKEECAELHRRVTELENNVKTSPEDGDINSKEEVKRLVSARLREERAKWFKDAQDYIRNEIESGIAQRGQHNGDEAWSRKLDEEVKRNVEMELDRMKHMMEVEIEEEVDQRLREQLEKEVKKLRTEGEKKEREEKKTFDVQVKQKLSVEIENLKIKFLSELEARVGKEKDQLEQDVKKWKEDMKKKIDGDKELFVAQMNREMSVKLSEQRTKVEAEMMQSKQEELKQMRNEMEEEMRKRIQREKMDWKKEEEEWRRKLNEGGERAEDLEASSAVRDRLRAAEEACNKAYMEREKAVEFLKRREASYKEDKQKLVAGLKQLRQDLNDTKEEQAVLEEKYAQMDRKYKEDMKEAKRKKELALEKLQAKCDQEKEKLIQEYKACIASMKEDFSGEIDRVRSEAEMERAAVLMEVRSHTERALNHSPLQEPDSETTTLFQLRDHYLETVTKIKEDVMTHVQAANCRAATTMKSEMRKQRRRLIQVFRERCKASVRSILAGQVSPNVLNSLDHTIDLIAEAMVTTPKSATSTNSAGSPSNVAALNTVQEKNLHHDNKYVDQTKTLGDRYEGITMRQGRGDDNAQREISKSKNHHFSSDDDRNVSRNGQERPQPFKSHPQLSKVDLYDSEAVDSSPQTSHNSSPASITLRTRAILHNSNRPTSSPPIPRLDLSPFQTPKELEHPHHDPQELQRRCQQEYSNKTKELQSRPHSAESTSKALQSKNTNSDFRHKISKPNFDDSGIVNNKEEPSPRDRMKMIEAQVRLANWAASGEMPWKGQGSADDAEKQRDSDLDNPEESLFVRPGKEAEIFLNAQRSAKSRDVELITPMKKYRAESKAVSQSRQPKKLSDLDGYMTDESNASHGSQSSFVTLEPDANQRSQLGGIQNSKGKEWAMYTTDYDRIKSAVFQNPDRTFANVTQRTPGRTAGFGLSSDDDVKSIDSDDGPQYKGLPTSTPAKRNAEDKEHYSRSRPEKQISKFSSSNKKKEDGEVNREHESQWWKTVNAFSETKNVGLEGNQGRHRSYSQPRPSKSQSSKQNSRDMVTAKSIDFEFPDISEITQASEDVHVGGGMWRYKSLEDLLPHQAAKRRGNSNEDRNHQNSYNSKQMSVARAAPPPIQAMNSDFWREQSLDDDDDVNEYSRTVKQRDDEQLSSNAHTRHLPVRHKAQSPSNFNTNRYDKTLGLDPGFTHSSSRHANLNPSTEPSWNKKRSSHSTNPVNPSYSASPSYPTHSQSRSKMSSKHHHHQQQMIPSYSSQFDAHVDDLRKSLETMEANPFSSMSKQKNKSKMKRSVSEQSLHTIQWDQDRSANIDDLVNAYTIGGPTPSHFDLHNFGHEEAF